MDCYQIAITGLQLAWSAYVSLCIANRQSPKQYRSRRNATAHIVEASLIRFCIFVLERSIIVDSTCQVGLAYAE